MWISHATRVRAVRVSEHPRTRTPLPQKDTSMTATPDLAPAPTVATPELFRSVFRRHAAGVAVITAQGERPVGFTATSLTSVAAEPPLISFGIGTSSSSWPVLSGAEYVGVHILGEHQRELATTFARSGADRFGPSTDWSSGPEGVPLLAACVRLAGLPRRVPGPGRGSPHRHRRGRGRSARRGRSPAGLPPGTVHGSARLTSRTHRPAGSARSQCTALAHGYETGCTGE